MEGYEVGIHFAGYNDSVIVRKQDPIEALTVALEIYRRECTEPVVAPMVTLEPVRIV